MKVNLIIRLIILFTSLISGIIGVFYKRSSTNTELIKIFGPNFEYSAIELSLGTHEIEISTKSTPSKVWFFVEGGLENLVGHKIVENGFVLHASIVSENSKIHWLVSFDKL